MHTFRYRNCRLLAPGKNWAVQADLFVQDGKIRAIGPECPADSGMAEIDLAGRAVIPGPVDAHCHLVSFGMQETREADLRGATSIAEVGARLRAHAERHSITPANGRWLLGRGFDQELFPGKRWPPREELDRIAADLPIRIVRICGHALVANTRALQLAGLDSTAASRGFSEGVLTEGDMAAVHRAVPPPAPEEWLQAARSACDRALRAGFVGVHSLMANAEEVRALVELQQEGLLPLRVVLQLPFHLLAHARDTGLRSGFGDDFLSLGAIKLFADGSLGARTAALGEPYSDDPSTSGELIHKPEELTRRVTEIYRSGFQSCIHTIGDAALEVTLDAIQAGAAGLSAEAWSRIPPPRIEHASLVNPALIQRMRSLGVGAAIQPQFAWSDHWVEARLGQERARGCYAFRSLWEAGVPLAGSTDCPVEPLDALAAMGSLVHRPPWLPDEGLPLETTLKVFSEGAYALLGRPAGSGALKIGAPADFVVLGEHPDRVPAAEIQDIPVEMTVVAGEVRYAAG